MSSCDVHISQKQQSCRKEPERKKEHKKNDILYAREQQDNLCRKENCLEFKLKHAKFNLKEEQVENEMLKEQIE